MAINTYSLARDGETQLSTNFKVREFYCPDTDVIKVDTSLVTFLQSIRDWANNSVTIIKGGGYRTEDYHFNVLKNTTKDSLHLTGQAADIVVAGKTQLQVAQQAESLGMKGIIIYTHRDYVHVDVRSSKYFAYNNNGSISTVNTFF